jgi:hypothetical protein
MAHRATAAHEPAPRADLALARDCEVCGGWGTVVTAQGRHSLCPACQTPSNSTPSA